MAGWPARRVGACRFVGQLPGAIMSMGGHHPAPASPVEQRVAALCLRGGRGPRQRPGVLAAALLKLAILPPARPSRRPGRPVAAGSLDARVAQLGGEPPAVTAPRPAPRAGRRRLPHPAGGRRRLPRRPIPARTRGNRVNRRCARPGCDRVGAGRAATPSQPRSARRTPPAAPWADDAAAVALEPAAARGHSWRARGPGPGRAARAWLRLG
jgi:hypothetical protein